MGPTAAGKTQFALQLAEQFPIELINVDSALIYRGMDIGTAKPDKATLTKYPHHLIDILEPNESYSAANFYDDVQRLIPDILARNKIPVLVGGTMMYFNTLFKGLAELPAADPQVREQLEQQLKQYGSIYLHDRLKKIDPLAAQKIHPNDPQRLQRALEVYELTGKPMSHHWQEQQQQQPYQFQKIAICPPDRAVLHQRIEQRFMQMLTEGFIDEVQALMNRGDLSLDLPSMRAVGYRQVWQYLQGDYDENTMQQKAIAATRQLAKRQITWLRSFTDVQWFEGDATKEIANIMSCPRKAGIHI